MPSSNSSWQKMPAPSDILETNDVPPSTPAPHTTTKIPALLSENVSTPIPPRLQSPHQPITRRSTSQRPEPSNLPKQPNTFLVPIHVTQTNHPVTQQQLHSSSPRSAHMSAEIRGPCTDSCLLAVAEICRRCMNFLANWRMKSCVKTRLNARMIFPKRFWASRFILRE